jgi:L-alanine-DL-glutamate epimerase-like enolase superfamily enzyme
MHGALRWGKSSSLSELRHVLVEVTLSDGATGVAEAPPRPTIYGETTSSITGIIEQELAPRIIGLSPVDAPPRLHEIKANNVAKGALDMALHAAVAQSKGVTLAEHLGVAKERVRVSYILGMGERETVLQEAERVYQQGVRVFKVKVGRDWDEDLARIAELQQRLGDDCALYADANETFTPENAARRLDQLREMGLLYCEEPLPVELIRERAALRAEGILPLIGDDSCFTPRDLRRELALDTFDVLNIKTPRTGYTDSLAMLTAARKQDKGVMVGSHASAGLGAAMAALFAGLAGVEHPSELSFFLKLKEDIVAAPLPLRDGYLSLADAVNVRVDPERLQEARA